MRIGQLARKYDATIEEIISYLKEIEPNHDSLHPNAKLDEPTSLMVINRFAPSTEIPAEDSSKADNELVIEDEVSAVEDESEVPQEELIEPIKEPEVQAPQKAEDEIIETDRLLELLESEEEPVDLDKIKLIKAPKRELDGLKVVGKIDLPEPKVKTVEESEQLEKDTAPIRNQRHHRSQLSDEEREKRRLKAKRKKEEYDARQKKRNKEREERQRKAKKKTHYEQKIQLAKSSQSKLKSPKQKQLVPPEIIDERPQPKTLMGRMWRWLNS